MINCGIISCLVSGFEKMQTFVFMKKIGKMMQINGFEIVFLFQMVAKNGIFGTKTVKTVH